LSVTKLMPYKRSFGSSFLRMLSVAAVLTAPPGFAASAQEVNEYQVKAAYVYNLAKFVEWPSGAFHGATDPIGICVFGQSPIADALEEAVAGEKIDDRRLIVHRVSEVQEANNCHILFIAARPRKHLRTILANLKTGGTLTVGETADFLEEGGALNFLLEGNKVRIEVNMNAVERQQFHISPKLLSLARVLRK
jgi:hypothetical protein